MVICYIVYHWNFTKLSFVDFYNAHTYYTILIIIEIYKQNIFFFIPLEEQEKV